MKISNTNQEIPNVAMAMPMMGKKPRLLPSNIVFGSKSHIRSMMYTTTAEAAKANNVVQTKPTTLRRSYKP